MVMTLMPRRYLANGKSSQRSQQRLYIIIPQTSLKAKGCGQYKYREVGSLGHGSRMLLLRRWQEDRNSHFIYIPLHLSQFLPVPSIPPALPHVL